MLACVFDSTPGTTAHETSFGKVEREGYVLNLISHLVFEPQRHGVFMSLRFAHLCWRASGDTF